MIEANEVREGELRGEARDARRLRICRVYLRDGIGRVDGQFFDEHGLVWAEEPTTILGVPFERVLLSWPDVIEAAPPGNAGVSTVEPWVPRTHGLPEPVVSLARQLVERLTWTRLRDGRALDAHGAPTADTRTAGGDAAHARGVFAVLMSLLAMLFGGLDGLGREIITDGFEGDAGDGLDAPPYAPDIDTPIGPGALVIPIEAATSPRGLPAREVLREVIDALEAIGAQEPHDALCISSGRQTRSAYYIFAARLRTRLPQVGSWAKLDEAICDVLDAGTLSMLPAELLARLPLDTSELAVGRARAAGRERGPFVDLAGEAVEERAALRSRAAWLQQEVDALVPVVEAVQQVVQVRHGRQRGLGILAMASPLIDATELLEARLGALVARGSCTLRGDLVPMPPPRAAS